MKFPRLLVIACLCAFTSHAAPLTVAPGGAPPQKVAAPDPVNYAIYVTWKNADKGTNTLQLVTCEGSFELDTVSGFAKIDDRDIPTTVKLSGSLTALGTDKGQMRLFIGRTVPYVTGSRGGPGAMSSYSQMSVGLQSNFVVTYGKPLIIQTDDSGEVILLVKRDVK